MSSALWQRQVTADSAARQCLDYVAKRTKYDGEGALPEVVLSVEVYMSLLCRFHAAETLVLGTWDPCAVVQAAAVQLNLNSIVLFGMKTKTKLEGLGLAQTPLLGVTNPGPGELVRVVADSSGKVGSSAKDESSGGVMKPHVAQVAAKKARRNTVAVLGGAGDGNTDKTRKRTSSRKRSARSARMDAN